MGRPGKTQAGPLRLAAALALVGLLCAAFVGSVLPAGQLPDASGAETDSLSSPASEGPAPAERSPGSQGGEVGPLTMVAVGAVPPRPADHTLLASVVELDPCGPGHPRGVYRPPRTTSA